MIETKLDPTDALEGIEELVDKAEDLPMEEIAQLLIDSVHRNFDVEGRPDAWASRKEPTGSWPLLRKTGFLYDSIEAQIEADLVTVISTADYAQYVDKDRPFLLIQDTDADKIEDILAKHFS